MGKKGSHDFNGTNLDVSQKKQKYSQRSGGDLQSAGVDQNHLQLNNYQKNTSGLATEVASKIDGDAHDHPRQASKSTQVQAPDSPPSGGPLRLKRSIGDGSYAGVGKSLNFSVIRESSSSKSINNGLSSNSAKVFVEFPPYNGHPSTLPPLPAIPDKDLESAAFTHPGSLGCDTVSKVSVSYDRLEFLGDAYIELMATRVIFPRFPRLTAGKLSQQRELLVKNETLAEFALAYGFDEKAKLPRTHNTPGKDRKLWQKTLGDIFEAYVAAVIISDPEQGFQLAEAWLAALWESKLGSQKREDTETADPKAKMHLATKILGKGVRVNYRDEAPPVEIREEGKAIFQVGVFLTGWGWKDQHLGSGKGLSKQEAGQKAAADALLNPLTAQVASVKRDFDSQVSLMRSGQGEAGQENDRGVGRRD